VGNVANWTMYRCVIAIRTSSGAVIIYMWKDNKWKEKVDLSISRYDQLKPSWDLHTLLKDDFDCLTHRVKQLQATGTVQNNFSFNCSSVCEKPK
jgi:hypothetical protein